jgi:nitroimidazol reductase NimA-like FMN-containing flavoprotein (pyridoxamine 5'-phosphate oxidase superfamily)
MLTELSEEECWELAATQPVGRIAWTAAAGPMVVPINFAVQDSRIVVHTSAYSELVREADDSVVAFEVDEYDPVTRSGWSVVFRGRARVAFHAPPGDRLPDVDSWADESRRMTMTVDVHEVSGRRVVSP